MPLFGVLTSTDRLVLEARHDDLHLKALLLRKAMNAGNIAVILPEDILLSVFKLYAAEPDHRGCYGWLVISWICARWRAIILHHVPLWATIPLGNLAAVECYLLRSREAPLHVSGSFISPSGSQYGFHHMISLCYVTSCEHPEEESHRRDMISVWSAILKHSSRIQGLTITLHGSTPTKHLLESGLQHATFPHLRRLEITGRTWFGCSGNEIPNFLQGVDEMVHLEEVDVTGIPLPLMLNLFYINLKKLHIGSCEYHRPQDAIPAAQLWSELQFLLNLEELSLVNMSSSSVPLDADMTHPSLWLPALKKLTIVWGDSTVDTATYFLDHVALPEGCRLIIRQQTLSEPKDGLYAPRHAFYLAALRALASRESMASLRTLHVAGTESSNYAPRLYFSTDVPAHPDFSPDPWTTPRSGFYPPLEITGCAGSARELGMIAPSLPLHAVEGLVLCGPGVAMWNFHVLTLRPRVLVVSGCPSGRAISKLCEDLSLMASLSALEELRLVGDHLGKDDPRWIDNLRWGLDTRRRMFRDSPLLRLVVDDLQLFEEMSEWAEEIYALVQSVEHVK